ncbi:transglycosylase domain-containing protein [Roseivirga sp. UBA1976]|uniref:penicillin-binding protein 1A n=1 Tax=Roseivirga sp. UBA1976 TaxID=1947386 RepID=UPI00257D6BE7|nr:transglycosylase domain-containing protein [Roseivirga sp. UBA1976]MEC7753968.1 transglycosylase domain-containing protein [Bacteroidota bacterium]
MVSRKKKNSWKRWIKWIGFSAVLGLLALFSFYLSVRWEIWEPLPSSEQLADIKQSQATEVYARGGELIGKYFIFDRQPVTFEEIPKHLIEALIATEDARFYEHNGVDRRSLLRVIFKSILMGDESAGGGSTLSQQLIKNLYPRKDHGIFSMPVSKIKEAICATRLEKLYSKEEIITLYLNTVPFGDNTYGVESAAEKFFGKRTEDLTLEESAVIVGMLKASHSYNPRLFPERSVSRRNTVLAQMERYGYLMNEQRQIASKKPLKLSYKSFSHEDGLAPYFRASLQKKLEKWLKEYNKENNTDLNLFTSGLRIYTTLDYNLQQMAEEALAEHLSSLQDEFEDSYGRRAPWLMNNTIIQDAVRKSDYYKKLKAQKLTEKQIEDSLKLKRPMELWDWEGSRVVQASHLDSVKHYLKFLQGGALSVDPFTGAVRTWVGGINFEHFQYDHVSMAKRQVGSTFKPIVYAAALEKGAKPCDYYSGQQVTYANYDNWTATNSGGESYDLNYAMKTALSKSINTVAVKVMEDAGIPEIIDLAHRMGIESDIPYVPSIALGTAEMNMLELAKAYTSFINFGKPAKPYFIQKIEDNKGKELAQFKPEVAETPVFSEENRQAMIEMMKGTVTEGTAQRLRWKYGLSNDIAGKTGTTQDNKDGWFVALTPRLITITWVGSDDHRIGFRTTAMGQGANSALPIYALFQQKMNRSTDHQSIAYARFSPPSTRVLNLMNCAPEKEAGFLRRIFVNTDKPKTTRLEIDSTAVETPKKEGLFKKIGNIFKKKNKKDN